MRAFITVLAIVALVAASASVAVAATGSRMIGINILLNRPVSAAILADLATYGKVRDVIREINAVTMQAPKSTLTAIRGEAYVKAANQDAKRIGKPVPSTPFADNAAGRNTWNLDAINVTNFGATPSRTIAQDGSGVYVAVIDTGLLSSWPYYFYADRIATQYARAFGGGGGENGNISSQPNKWQTDQNSHGTHVTSTILGYNLRDASVNGVAPKATVIPVKVLNQNGSGWSSVVARGITYVADLKAAAGPLHGSPVVINMSLGGPALDAIEQAAIDYAIAQGVIVVASAGNEGEAGMGYPGAYEPVISAAASGWIGEWPTGNRSWWNNLDVPESTVADNSYITAFSSREKDGQDLDVAAPGSWVVGPYQTNGQISYFFLGGTSMASPHVAGVVALMAQKHNALTAAQAESILEGSAVPLPAGSRDILGPTGPAHVVWGADATGAGLMDAAAAISATP